MLYYGQNVIYWAANMVYYVQLCFCSNIGMIKGQIGPLWGVPRIGKRPIYFRFFLLKASLTYLMDKIKGHIYSKLEHPKGLFTNAMNAC